MRAFPLTLLSLTLVGFLGGCGGQDLAPPEGWTGDGERWWRVGADTAWAFRDLETFRAMGVERDGGPLRGAVRDELFPFYRSNPEVVDSLFRRRVGPILDRAEVRAGVDTAAVVTAARRELAFRQPRPRLQLGSDVSVAYPDSLRSSGVGGRVGLQVALDREGAPVAVRVVEGVHPTLNRSALLAATQMRWSRAYAVQEPVPAWVFWNVVYNAGS